MDMKSEIKNLRSEIRDLKSLEKSRSFSSSSGQAMVEMLVGIVALLVLIAGLLQVVTLSSTQTATMVEARHLAGIASIDGVDSTFTPDYIKDWQAGPDGKRYTTDDVFTPGDTSMFEGTIIGKASPPDNTGWTTIDSVPNNMLSVIHNSGMPQDELGLVKGTDSSNVVVVPIIQTLVYGADSITINSDVRMTSTTEIY